MARVLVVIAMICAVAALALVYNLPIQPTRVESASDENLEAAQKEKDSSTKKGRSTSRKRSRQKKGDGDSQLAGTTDSEPKIPGRLAETSTDGSRDTSVIVKKDSTAVYTLNSPASAVVDYLKRGDRVTSDLEVIQSDGSWRLIKGEDQSSGYVKSENLDLKQPLKRLTPVASERRTKKITKP